jgi:hypothetical protein
VTGCPRWTFLGKEKEEGVFEWIIEMEWDEEELRGFVMMTGGRLEGEDAVMHDGPAMTLPSRASYG